jgi:DNA primase
MTIDEMEGVLDRLGIEVISVVGDEIKGHCPAHLERTGKEDGNPSWFINADSGVHHCFSCGFRGSVASLVAYTQGVAYEEANSWLGSGERNLTRAFERLIAPPKKEEQVQEVTESMLSAFVDPPEDALKSRGLTLQAAQYYGLLWNARTSSWVTPMRDLVTGSLIGWQEKAHKGRHFNNFPTGVKKSNTVFGYHKYTSGPMIVVESPLDAVRLFSVGVSGGVSTYGCSISKVQVNAIRGADSVIFALDNDKAGIEASKEMLDACKEYKFDAYFFDYSGTDMKDVGGMSKSEILSGLTSASHSVHGRKLIGKVHRNGSY